ncbi:MAG: TlpA disulfide reductase family protein [Steroidobacteraceae bacterium]
MRTFLTWAALPAAVIVAAGLAGFLAYGWLARPAPLMRAVNPPRDLTPMRPDGGSDAAVSTPGSPPAAHAAPGRPLPDTLPDIALTDREGVARRLSDWKGRPLLVNFWATWCGPCRQEIPLLERLSHDRAPDGLQVIGIAVDSRAAVLDYARREAIEYPLLIGEQPGLELIRALGMQAVFPFSVFVDARGRIVTTQIGILRADQARLILGRVDDLDRGRIDLATARQQIADGIRRLAIGRATGRRPAHFIAQSLRP